MDYATLAIAGTIHVLFFIWPCEPKQITGQAYGQYHCETVEKVWYDMDKATLFCIDGKIWAECPLEIK